MEYGVGVKLVTQFVVSLAANVIALLVAAIALDRFTVSTLTFPIVVVVFTIVGMVARPVVGALVEKYALAARSFIGLAAAFVTLLVTDMVSDRLDVEGIGTWIVATLIVWVGQLAADLAVSQGLLDRLVDRRRAAG